MTLAELSSCCGCAAWAQGMYDRQPFSNTAAMHAAADEIWWSLTPQDWLEAFSQHPKIGRQSSAKWAAGEQSGMAAAHGETLSEMARLNAAYDAKFGFIFIVCATGKSAEEMLTLLKARVNNTRDEEIRIAAGEQAKITHLRLEKLLHE